MSRSTFFTKAKLPVIAGRQGGFALVGVMVGVVIFLGGVIGIAGMHSQATRSNHDSLQRSHALWLANDVAERLKANIDMTSKYVATLDKISDLTSWCSVPTNCGGNNKCTSTLFIDHDIEELICRNDNFSSLVSPELDIDCDGSCGAGDEVTITVSWDSRGELAATGQQVELVFIRE